MKCRNTLARRLRSGRVYAVCTDKRGMILATVVVMSVLIMALCSTVVILSSYNNNKKLLLYKESANTVSLRQTANAFVETGGVTDENGDMIVDDTSWSYVILSDVNYRTLVLRSIDGEKILLAVSLKRTGDDWITDGWYEYPDDILTETTTPPSCGEDGERVYTLPNGAEYLVETLTATGQHDFQDGVCTVCGQTQS